MSLIIAKLLRCLMLMTRKINCHIQLRRCSALHTEMYFVPVDNKNWIKAVSTVQGQSKGASTEIATSSSMFSDKATHPQ